MVFNLQKTKDKERNLKEVKRKEPYLLIGGARTRITSAFSSENSLVFLQNEILKVLKKISLKYCVKKNYSSKVKEK